MTHIEFIGPPGAGKSSIHQQIVTDSKYYQGCRRRSTKQWLKELNKRYRIIYDLVPSFVQKRYQHAFLQPRLDQAAFFDFVQKYPRFLHIMSIIIEEADYEPKWLYSACRDAAIKYQSGLATTNNEEIFCLDESFLQRSVSILWRFDNNDFSLGDYLRNTPTPKLLIYVDAPINICIERQKTRGKLTVSKLKNNNSVYEEQKTLSEICERVVDQVEKQTTVIRINNVGDVENSIDNTLSGIEIINDNK